MGRPQSLNTRLENAIEALGKAMESGDSRKQLSAQTMVETIRSMWLQEKSQEENDSKRQHELATNESLKVAEGLKGFGLSLDDVRALQQQVIDLQNQLRNTDASKLALEAKQRASAELEHAAQMIREMRAKLEAAEQDSFRRWNPFYRFIDGLPADVRLKTAYKVCQQLEWKGCEELLKTIDCENWPSYWREFNQPIERVRQELAPLVNCWQYLATAMHTVDESTDILQLRGDVIAARIAAMKIRGETIIRWHEVKSNPKVIFALLVVDRLSEGPSLTRGACQMGAMTAKGF